MSRSKFLFSLLVLVLVASFGQASRADEIAVVNYQLILKDSSAAKSANTQLETRKKQYQAEISKSETDLQKEKQDLEKQQTILAKDAFEQRVTQFRDKATKMQNDVRQKRIVLSKAGDAALGQILQQVTAIIGEIAKEKGFKVAIASGQLLYADSSLDITAEVLKRLNQRLPSVTVKFQ